MFPQLIQMAPAPPDDAAQLCLPCQKPHDDANEDLCQLMRLFPAVPGIRNITQPVNQRAGIKACLNPPPVSVPIGVL